MTEKELKKAIVIKLLDETPAFYVCYCGSCNAILILPDKSFYQDEFLKLLKSANICGCQGYWYWSTYSWKLHKIGKIFFYSDPSIKKLLENKLIES